MSKYTIGIDFGSLSARAVLVDTADGRQLGESVMNYPHAVISDRLPATGEVLPPDWALQDHADYLECLAFVIRGAIAEAKIDKNDIIGIGIDFTTCTVLPILADGTPLATLDEFRGDPHAYVKLWKHHGATKYADAMTDMARARGERFLDCCGGKVDSEWLFPKLWQILEEAPHIYNAADGFIEAGEWVTMMLTGRRVRGYVYSAIKAHYIEEEGGYPSEDFFASLNEGLRHVVRDKLNAPMARIGELVGYVTAEAAEKFGLPEGIAVSAPLPDAHSSAISLGLANDGDICSIMGTSTCNLLISHQRRIVDGICGVINESVLPGYYGYEAGLCCVGDLFAWAEKNCTSAEYVREAEERGMPMIKLLVEKAAKKAPGEGGILALGWFNGNRNLLIDPTRSGMMVGMTLASRPEDIFRALIESTAFGIRNILEAIEGAGVHVGRFIAAGGIARKDPFTMQLYADILGREIHIATTAQACALSGAITSAAVAGASEGGYDSLPEAIAHMASSTDRVYTPNSEASVIYDKLYAEYMTLHDYFGRGGNDVMRRLRNINN